MSQTPRRSTRNRNPPTPIIETTEIQEGFAKGQGLVKHEGKTFQLFVVDKDASPNAKIIQCAQLEESGGKLLFKKSKNVKLKPSDIDDEIDLKKQGDKFRITKKQYNDIIKNLEAESEVESEEDLKPVKKAKKSVAKAPKVKGKKITAYKRGVFNPDVKLVKETGVFSGNDNQPDWGISTTINNKNLHRAVVTGNYTLLNNCVKSQRKISSLIPIWGPDFRYTPLDLAILNNDIKMIKELLKLLAKPPKKMTHDTQPQLGVVQTGHVGIEAFGVMTRTVQMSRGGREGNNALLFDWSNRRSDQFDDFFMQNVLPFAHEDAINTIINEDNHFGDAMAMQIGNVVRSGNVGLARDLITLINKRGGYGFNFLHEQVLKKGALSAFKKPSITKKPIENFCVAPLHVACINPDTKHLETLLKQTDDIGYADQTQRRAIHYAAASPGPKALEMLLKHGANPNDMDRLKVTPIMMSGKYNRPEAAEVLLKAGVNVNAKSREGMAAIHYAAFIGGIDVIKVLLKYGANINQPGTDRKTPLMFAASMGHYELCEFLLENGARTTTKDKCKRTALIWAIRNGWVHIASLLLLKGSPINEPDSSKNSALHYAAGYGWIECLELLLKYGADKNAENDWKLEPLLVAMLKGQNGIVMRLLNEPGVNVDCKDDNGRTLLSQSVSQITQESIDMILYLLTHKQADVNMPDFSGFTPLHHLSMAAKFYAYGNYTKEQMQQMEQDYNNLMYKIGEILLDNGAQIDAQDKKGSSPLFKAFEHGNSTVIKLLIDRGADMYQVSQEQETILHKLSQFNPQIFPSLINALQNQDLARFCIPYVNDYGKTALHTLIDSYISQANSVWSAFYQEESQKAQKEYQQALKEIEKGKNTQEIIDNNPLFKQSDTAINLNNLQNGGFTSLFGGARTKQVARKSYQSGKLLGRTAPKRSAAPSLIFQQSDLFVQSNLLSLDNEEISRRANERYNEVLGQFFDILDLFQQNGADFNQKIGKIRKYADNPDLRRQEYEEAKAQHEKQQNMYHYNFDESQYFTLDIDGNAIWNEYHDYGLETPLHLAIQSRDLQVFERILDQTQDLDCRSYKGLTALYKAIQQSSFNQAKQLLEKGANPNLADIAGQTPLLIASSQQSLEMVNLLLQNGAIGDVQDKSGKSPLREAVISKNLQIVQALLDAGVSPNIPDLKQRTPLHHAFNNAEVHENASFELESLLLEYGGDINAFDCRNRTPLHYAFVKIGRPHDTSNIDPIETVSSACGRPGVNANLVDKWNRTPLHYAARRGALTSSMMLINSGAELDLKDLDGNTALGLSIICNHVNYAVMLLQQGANCFIDLVIPPKKENQQNQQNSFNSYNFGLFQQHNYNYNQSENLEEGTYTLFKAAIIKGWQGLAYLILYKGYNYMLAMQDAMNQHKFQLVLTLLAKVGDDSVVQGTNKEGQNLFHTLAIFGKQSSQQHLTAIGQKLLRRGVQISSQDVFGRSPIHYAAKNQFIYLINFLSMSGCALDVKDNKGQTPLILAIKKQRILTAQGALESLKQAGIDLNVQFEQKGRLLTPLIHAIEQKVDLKLIIWLINNGASFIEPDSDGQTPLIHAIKSNNFEIVKGIISYMNAEKINYRSSNGWTALNYIVSPFPAGSYENLELFKLLVDQGADLHTKDNEQKSLYYYAFQQKSWIIKNYLDEIGLAEDIMDIDAQSPYTDTFQTVDYQQDAENYLKQQLEVKKVNSDEKVPDEVGQFGPTYEVVDDYDIYMVRVDLQYGPYSAYLFYRMQLLHDMNRDVYVVFTRWGRIGETGAYQRTPFSVKEEAQTEFHKIFKSKSGNEWGTEFKRIPKKYKLIKLIKNNVNYNDFLKRFDLKDCLPSQLDKKIQDVIKYLSDVKVFNTYLNNVQVNTNILNFSVLSKDVIKQAKDILFDLLPIINKIATSKNQDLILELKEQIYDLSNQFYELIPLQGYEHSPVPAILNQHDLARKMDFIETLLNCECASKMILGAWNQIKALNPLDYVYNALRLNFEVLDNNSQEYGILSQYIKQSSNAQIVNIFKIEREGEFERVQKYSNSHQRMLLWHGSASVNFLSILNQGLKTPKSLGFNYGGMFGSGIYFADLFQKSQGYTCPGLNYNVQVSSPSNFMLACEVVLGKMLQKYQAENIEKLPSGYLSVKGLGQNIPDPNFNVYLKDGVVVPIGPTIQAPQPQAKNQYYQLAYNEYIVYNSNQRNQQRLLQENEEIARKAEPEDELSDMSSMSMGSLSSFDPSLNTSQEITTPSRSRDASSTPRNYN